MSVEYGVRYDGSDGSFVAGGYTRGSADRMVAEFKNAKGMDPKPSAVVQREVGDWQEAQP